MSEQTLRRLSRGLFSELYQTLSETTPSERAAWMPEWIKYQQGRNSDADYMAHVLVLASPIVDAEPDDPEPDPISPERKPFTAGILASVAFLTSEYPREFMVQGIVVVGQPCIIGGPRKALKTTTAVDLAISIGTATRFLDEFSVPRSRRVLFLSGESGNGTIQETAKRVCQAKGLNPYDLEGRVLWGFDLPKLSDDDDMTELARFVSDNHVEVVIIDPLYLCLLSGNSKLDAANLFDVGPLLASITSTCLNAGATPLLIHHLRKNRDNPEAPPELEDLAFAGVQEFARQWILLGRREAYEPGTGDHKLWLSVGGSAGHSGAWAFDVKEGVIDDDFAGREWSVKITKASDARAESVKQSVEAKAAKLAETAKIKDDATRRKLCNDVEDAFAKLKKSGRMSKTEWRDSLAWNSTRFGPVLAELESQKRIRIISFEGPKGRGIGTIVGYEIGDPDECRTMPDYAGFSPNSPALDSIGKNAGLGGGSPPLRGEPPESAIHSRSKLKKSRSSKSDSKTEKSPAFEADGIGGPP